MWSVSLLSATLSASPGSAAASEAVTLHQLCKLTSTPACWKEADRTYRAFLTKFPNDGRASTLRFFWAELLNEELHDYEKAATQYERVLTDDPINQYARYAAYDAVLALDELVKQAIAEGRIAPIPKEGFAPWDNKVVLPPLKQRLLAACDRYVRRFPDGDHVVEVAYKAAKILYDYNYSEEASPRFASIALEHPDSRFENGDSAGEVCANLVLDDFNLRSDWSGVNAWARRFYALKKLGSPKFRADLELLIVQSEIKRLELRGAARADALVLAAETTDFPEKKEFLLDWAAWEFRKAGRLDQALEQQQRAAKLNPDSGNLERLAELLELAGRVAEAEALRAVIAANRPPVPEEAPQAEEERCDALEAAVEP